MAIVINIMAEFYFSFPLQCRCFPSSAVAFLVVP